MKDQPVIYPLPLLACATGLLAVAFAPMPYDYYLVLRWVLFGIFGYFAITTGWGTHPGWLCIWGLLAALYNPFVKVGFPRSTWEIANAATIAILVFAAHKSRLNRAIDSKEAS